MGDSLAFSILWRHCGIIFVSLLLYDTPLAKQYMGWRRRSGFFATYCSMNFRKYILVKGIVKLAVFVPREHHGIK